jgi:hypothetical protein
MARKDVVEFVDVEVLSYTGIALVCVVGGKRVMVPPRGIQWGSTAWRPGDRGTLIIPRLLAETLGMI